MIWKYILAWFGMMILAIMNGGIRDMVYKQYVGNLAAHQISTVILLVLISAYLWFVMKMFPMESLGKSWLVGGMWFVMTEVFEFGMGIVSGKSWNELFQAYNVMAGQVWILIPLWVFIFPPLCYNYIQTK